MVSDFHKLLSITPQKRNALYEIGMSEIQMQN